MHVITRQSILLCIANWSRKFTAQALNKSTFYAISVSVVKIYDFIEYIQQAGKQKTNFRIIDGLFVDPLTESRIYFRKVMEKGRRRYKNFVLKGKIIRRVPLKESCLPFFVFRKLFFIKHSDQC